MSSLVIRNVTVVNEGNIFKADVSIINKRIHKISKEKIESFFDKEINGQGLHLMPGMIDDQVHFREPGLTHKATIHSESRAAIAGGVTSFMEMPNTIPNAVTQELLEQKYKIASKNSLANYSFYMGVTNNNINEVLNTNPNNVCGIKIFMGSSTGNMLVDKKSTLDNLFQSCKMLIATHCEDEATILKNTEFFKSKYGTNLPISYHPLIRNEEACYKSSSTAVELAMKYNSRLHVLHISTSKELELFNNALPLKEKRITSEACIHHLWFNDKDYDNKGTFIKWNPAIKTESDRLALIQAINDNKIDVIATDHAPHTLEEKNNNYFNAPSGGPLVQHPLLALIDLVKKGFFSLEKIVQKTSHNVADCFQIKDRGYIREGYFADLVLIDLNQKQNVTKNQLLYKCKWSPFEGHTFNSKIRTTIVNGEIVYSDGAFYENSNGMRLTFER